jgi:hypothetical protein
MIDNDLPTDGATQTPRAPTQSLIDQGSSSLAGGKQKK